MSKASLLVFVVLLGMAGALSAHASDVGADFNDHSLNVYGGTALQSFVPSAVNAAVGGGFLFDDHNPGDYLKFIHIDLVTTGGLGVNGATGSVGLRGFYGNREHFSGGGLALGGRVSYYFPAYNRIGLSGGLWYAPNILTGGDFQHYFQYGIDVDYQLLRQATVYAGYRRLDLPISGPAGSVRADAPSQGFHLGIRIEF